MNFFDRLLGRKATTVATTPPGSSVTFLGGDQGSSRRMTNYRSLLGAISVPNVWKCCSVIGSNASATPLLWRDPDGSEVDLKAAAPELYTLLRQPNPETRSLAFTQSIVLDLLLCGNFFCLLDEHDGLGRPHALYRWSPDRVRILRSDVGKLAYGVDAVQNGVTRTEWYDQASVLHIKTFFNPRDPLFGLGPTEAAELSISKDRLIGEYALNFFQKGAIVDSVLVSPQPDINEEDRRALIEGWNAFRSGARNKFKTALLFGGAEFHKVQENIADVQLPQLAAMALEDVCQAYGVPKQMLGDFESTNMRNSEQSNSFFITETLTPLLRQIQEEFWVPLGEYFDPDLTPEYGIREVNDFLLRTDSALKLANTGAATVDQVLVMAGLDPRGDDIGERLVQPQGVTLAEPDAGALPGAEPGMKSFPPELLSRKRREEQRRRGIVQRPPRDPAEPLLRLLAGSEVGAGVKAADAPAPSEGRVTVSARPTEADVARVAKAYSAWSSSHEESLWDAVEDVSDGAAQA